MSVRLFVVEILSTPDSPLLSSYFSQATLRNSDGGHPTEYTPEGHMSSVVTTARRADDQRRSVDDVSVCAISETGTQSAATSQNDDFILDALRHVKAQASGE